MYLLFKHVTVKILTKGIDNLNLYQECQKIPVNRDT